MLNEGCERFAARFLSVLFCVFRGQFLNFQG